MMKLEVLSILLWPVLPLPLQVCGFTLSESGRTCAYVPLCMANDDRVKARSDDSSTPARKRAPGASSDLECNLAESFDRENQERSSRRTPVEQKAPKFVELIFDGVLELFFVRRQNAAKLRQFFLTKRSYARNETFGRSQLGAPPVVEDLLPYPTPLGESFYLSIPAAFLTFFVTSAVFPSMVDLLDDFIDIPPEKLEAINSKLVPGISILYGTFMSLTLSILYDRQRQVQDSVAKETALLSLLLHDLISLFKNDRAQMVRAGQSVADQVRILLKENRGIEYMSIIYTDPYLRVLDIIREEEERLVELHGHFDSKGPLLNSCRDAVKDLRQIRASRLSDESLFLPQTHYFILKALTFLLLIGYFFSVLPTVDELGYAPFESSVLFGTLCTVYLLFYAFANDLNDLYSGVFQIRRGSSASNLLAIKKMVADQPWLKFEVDFERVNREIICFYPGLAQVWFENEQNFQPGQLK